LANELLFSDAIMDGQIDIILLIFHF